MIRILKFADSKLCKMLIYFSKRFSNTNINKELLLDMWCNLGTLIIANEKIIFTRFVLLIWFAVDM